MLGGEFGAVVHPVLDAPGGRSLLHPGELPAKSVAGGNAAVVVELIEKATGDVIAVFDGVRLVYGGGAAAKGYHPLLHQGIEPSTSLVSPSG